MLRVIVRESCKNGQPHDDTFLPLRWYQRKSCRERTGTHAGWPCSCQQPWNWERMDFILKQGSTCISDEEHSETLNISKLHKADMYGHVWNISWNIDGFVIISNFIHSYYIVLLLLFHCNKPVKLAIKVTCQQLNWHIFYAKPQCWVTVDTAAAWLEWCI